MIYTLLHKDEVGNLVHMSSLKGRLSGITYNDMINTFGDPTYSPEDSGDGKVNFEWVFENENGEAFTIYDWKCPEDYTKFILGRPDEIQFHVGGKSFAGDFIEFIENTVMSNLINK